MGGGLTVTLLRGIGQPVETHEMHAEFILAAVQELRQRAK
jgi:hypothetical protein